MHYRVGESERVWRSKEIKEEKKRGMTGASESDGAAGNSDSHTDSVTETKATSLAIKCLTAGITWNQE